MAKTPAPTKTEVKGDTSLLTQDQLAAIELEAEAAVREEAIEAAKKTALAEFTAKHKRKKGLTEPYVDVTIDLAPYCDRILLDNRAFLQGQTYNVPHSVAAVMNESMQKTWNHQAEIDGKSENFYRRTRGQRVVPAGNGGAAVVNTTQILRA